MWEEGVGGNLGLVDGREGRRGRRISCLRQPLMRIKLDSLTTCTQPPMFRNRFQVFESSAIRSLRISLDSGSEIVFFTAFQLNPQCFRAGIGDQQSRD